MSWSRSEVARALDRVEAAAGPLTRDSAGAADVVDQAFLAPRDGALVVGLTGPPGVGKSTLAGRLVARWREAGLTVGVLCVDPSSRASGGALLGDRVRMRLSGRDEGVFVRSMAARSRLGGLAPATLDALVVMRAAFDRVLVETVGVGQSEIEVAEVADLTIVVVQPGSGDALQFVKAGLMEVFDLLVVNKADLGSIAEAAARELRHALRVRGRRDEPVLSVAAEPGLGVAELAEALERLAAARPDRAARRDAAMRRALVRRFSEWHGLARVVKLGGEAALVGALAVLPTGVAPSRLWAALEELKDA